MSDSDQSGAGRREVAYRLFAAEYDDADFSYSESDEERAPNYVVTPTGARVNRLFVVGVLTEVETVGDDVLRARVVDPTGAFVLYAGQYQPDEQAFLESAETPAFVAVTGKARTFQPDDADRVYTSVRPESINEVTAETRDRWTVQTAEQTLTRVEHVATALSLDERGDALASALVERGVDEGLAAGIALAIDHYGTAPGYLAAVRKMALDAARLVAGDVDEVESVSVSPDVAGEADLGALGSTAPETVAVVDAARTDRAQPSGRGESDSASGPAETDTAESAATTGTGAETESETRATAAGDHAVTDESGDAGDEGATDTGTTAAPDTGPTDAGSEAPATGAAGAEDGAGEVGDFEPGEFELDDEEREEIEAEYGTEFQSGTEVEEPGEADIETPDPGESAPTAAAEEPSGATPEAEAPAEATTDTGAQSDGATETPSGPAAETGDASGDTGGGPAGGETAAETTESPDAAADVDLEEATVEVMTELDDGDGADREAVVDAVADRYGVGPDEVRSAIQDALMDGRCYEPDDDTLKPI